MPQARVKLKRRSGRSTITQQLSGTLFIQDLSKLIRRKSIEIPLALWCNRNFSKDEQLNIYLASVRFEKGVYGVTEAMKHFWGDVRLAPTMAESFFLVERVSNIKSKLLTNRIIQISKEALKK